MLMEDTMLLHIGVHAFTTAFRNVLLALHLGEAFLRAFPVHTTFVQPNSDHQTMYNTRMHHD